MTKTAKPIALIDTLFPDRGVRKIIGEVDKARMGNSNYQQVSWDIIDADSKILASCSNAACFANLASTCGEARPKKHTGLISMRYKPNAWMKNATTAVRWITLGQQLGVLTDPRPASTIYKKGFEIVLEDKELTICKLYLALCFLRYLGEGKDYVENVLKLVDGAGCDFWAAGIFCHRNLVNNVGHSIFPFTGTYGNANVKAGPCNLSLVIHMHHLPKTHKKLDPRNFWGTAIKGGYSGSDFWRFHKTAIIVKKNIILKDPLMLLSSEVYPIISSSIDDIKSAIPMARELGKRSNKIVFAEIS